MVDASKGHNRSWEYPRRPGFSADTQGGPSGRRALLAGETKGSCHELRIEMHALRRKLLEDRLQLSQQPLPFGDHEHGQRPTHPNTQRHGTGACGAVIQDCDRTGHCSAEGQHMAFAETQIPSAYDGVDPLDSR